MDPNVPSDLGISVEKAKSQNGSEQPKESKFLVFDIHKEPVMQTSLEVLSLIGKYKAITLRAKGDSIPNAVTVANIITSSMLKGNSKIYKITVSSEPIQKLGKILSTIEIILKKN